FEYEPVDSIFLFFFQAEDGIRDFHVTGVQTCALPISAWQVTPVEFSEWGNATVLALVASGLGMGLYWQSSLSTVQQQDVASKTVLPIWIAQLVAVIAFAFFA